MDLHAWLKSVVEERLALAKESTLPEFRDWVAYPHPPGWRDADKTKDVHLVGSEDQDTRGGGVLICETGQHLGAAVVARFIAAHDPADAIRRHEAALRVLERHRPCACDLSRDMPHCVTHRCPADAVDVEIGDLAASYGVEVD